MTSQELLARLPKSKHFVKNDLAAAGCFAMLLQGDDPVVVIDELLFYYSSIVADLRNAKSSDIYNHDFIQLIGEGATYGRNNSLQHQETC